MSGFEAEQVYFTDQNLQNNQQRAEFGREEALRRIKRFIREFQRGDVFIYRKQLQANGSNSRYFLKIDTQDINHFDHTLYTYITLFPLDTQEGFEHGIKEVFCELRDMDIH